MARRIAETCICADERDGSRHPLVHHEAPGELKRITGAKKVPVDQARGLLHHR